MTGCYSAGRKSYDEEIQMFCVFTGAGGNNNISGRRLSLLVVGLSADTHFADNNRACCTLFIHANGAILSRRKLKQ